MKVEWPIYLHTKERLFFTCWHAYTNALNSGDGFHCLQYVRCTSDPIFTSLVDFKPILIAVPTYTKYNTEENIFLIQIHHVNTAAILCNYAKWILK